MVPCVSQRSSRNSVVRPRLSKLAAHPAAARTCERTDRLSPFGRGAMRRHDRVIRVVARWLEAGRPGKTHLQLAAVRQRGGSRGVDPLLERAARAACAEQHQRGGAREADGERVGGFREPVSARRSCGGERSGGRAVKWNGASRFQAPAAVTSTQPISFAA